MHRIRLEIESLQGTETVSVDIKRLLLVGYSGRNQETVRKHVEELKMLGVPVPNRVPALYEVNPSLLTTEDSIEVHSISTSGEVEFVLVVVSEGEIYVTVGSDHTDREIEKVSVLRAKEACPKVIAPKAWPYREVLDHWDDLLLRSVLNIGSQKMIYQEGTLSLLLHPEHLLDTFNARSEGTVLFSGTIPTKGDIVLNADVFEIYLTDPELNREINHSYKVIVR